MVLKLNRHLPDAKMYCYVKKKSDARIYATHWALENPEKKIYIRRISKGYKVSVN